MSQLAVGFRVPLISKTHHVHKCEGCGLTWQHSEECAGEPECHICPKCGKPHQSSRVSRFVGAPDLTFYLPHKPSPELLKAILEHFA